LGQPPVKNPDAPRGESAPVVYGVNPLWGLVNDHPGELLGLYVTAGKKGPQIIKVLAAAASCAIPVVEVDRVRLRRLAGSEHHQGIVGVVRPYAYADFEELTQITPGRVAGSMVVVLDGITDPQNLGAIIRTAYCFGAAGLIIPRDRAAAVTAAVEKASAGAVRQLPVARVTNLSRALDDLKDRGFWVYGTDVTGGQDVRSVVFAERTALVLGSEGKGLRDLVRKKCDFFLSIPMVGKLGSLNVSVAAGIIMAEIFRGRRELQGGAA
jgi:23S rRNA (guanosine2251-2'-O)-methyltransferase